MDQPFESEVMDELAAETPLSSAEEFAEFEGMEGEGFEEGLFDEMGGFAEDYAENGFEDGFEESFEDGFEEGFEDGFEGDLGEDYFNESEEAEGLDALEAAVADALEAEDGEEFLRRVASGLRRAAGVARQVGRRVGQVARTVAPIASAIPLPQAQAIARVANVAGRLLADGADEFEALDEMLNLAEEGEALDAAIPMIAGLTIRTTMPQASRLPRSTRRQLVRSVSQSTRTLARRQGTQAVRVVPRMVQAVQRTAQRRRMSTRQIPQAVSRTTARVARDRNLVRRLSRPSRPTRTRIGATSCGCRTRREQPRRFVIRGPVEIVITSR